MAEFDWGEYTESSGGVFVTELEKLTYIANGTVVAITGVREGEGQYGPQWYLDFTDPNGEEKTWSFKKGNPERDGRMTRLQATINATGEPIAARFLKVGKRYDVAGAA